MSTNNIDVLAKQEQAAYMREWRAKNKAKINDYHKTWTALNKDKVQAANKRYWEKKAMERMKREDVQA